MTPNEMRRVGRTRRISSVSLAAAAGLLIAASRASAKIAFTGYSDVLATANSSFRVRGPASVLSTTPEGNLISRGFSLSRLGLFATTELPQESRFLIDVTYSRIGQTVGQTSLQYAYWEAPLPGDLRVEIGKITVPFGYYNRHRFYSFRRAELGAPVYQSGILGLPIADLGGALFRRFGPQDGLALEASVYAVNGYGNVSGSTASLRLPTTPGALAISGNLGSSNNNKNIAFGGQLALTRGGWGELGGSYYRGAWDPDSRRMLQLAGAHLHLTPGRADFLAEYFHLHARGDEGMLITLGDTTWKTHGLSAVASHPLFSVRQREVVGHLSGEAVSTRRNGGGKGQEVLRAAGGGLSSRLHESLLLKAEGKWLYYRLPFVADRSLILEGFVTQFSMIVTF